MNFERSSPPWLSEADSRGAAVRKLAVLLSDTHAGHKLALLNPTTQLWQEDEEGNLHPYNPRLTAVQEYLWDLYNRHIDRTLLLAHNDPLVVLHVGDSTWGQKYIHQLVSTSPADQVAMAVANLRGWLDIPDVKTLRLAHSTQSHAFYEGTSDILIAEQLAGMYPGRGVRAFSHARFDIDGVLFDVAHHGPTPGSRKWLEGNEFRYYIRSLAMQDLLRGETPPRVVVRAHYHKYVRETVRIQANGHEYVVDGVILPSYCGLTDFGRQAVKSPFILSNGLVVAEVVAGRLVELHPFVQTIDLRTKERL